MTFPQEHDESASCFMAWKDLHANLWYYEYYVRKMGISLPVKTLAVKLENKSLMIISPGEPVEKIDPEFGSVDYLIAPTTFHHTHLDAWAKMYPKAKIYAHMRVQEKHPSLKFAGTLQSAPVNTWKNDLDMHIVAGNDMFEEAVFFHKPSRTLILTDLCFNLQNIAQWWPRTFWKLWGVYGKATPSRLVRRMITDKKAFHENMDKILNRTIKQVVVSHGEVIQKNCKDTLMKAFEKVA